MRPEEVSIRALTADDLRGLANFNCSTGTPWEDVVEEQIRGPLPRRYLASPPRFDGRMLIGTDANRNVLAVGAHHIEPTLEPDVGYTEVVAVSLEARGRLVQLPGDQMVSLGEFMFFTIFKQMLSLGRHPRTFVRVDRRNQRCLALCDRVGLVDEHPDPQSGHLVQRWGELPQSI